MAIAENIQTMQAFLGYFNPAQAERMARGCRIQTRGKAGSIKVAGAIERTADGPVTENIQTMQTFLGYFNPAQAERMARGCRGHAGGEVTGAKDQAADEWLLQALSALQDVFRDWEITIEEAQAEGDKVAVRFAAPNHQLQSSWAAEPAIGA
jgi:hypothetical protein